MGNKRRAFVIIFAVILSALVIFPVTIANFGKKNVNAADAVVAENYAFRINVNNAYPNASVGKKIITAMTTSSTYTLNGVPTTRYYNNYKSGLYFNNVVYIVFLSSQSRDAYTNDGACSVAFLKKDSDLSLNDSSFVSIANIADYARYNYCYSTYSNFALPSDAGEGTFYNATDGICVNKNYDSNWRRAAFEGYSTMPSDTSEPEMYYGRPATREEHGRQGLLKEFNFPTEEIITEVPGIISIKPNNDSSNCEAYGGLGYKNGGGGGLYRKYSYYGNVSSIVGTGGGGVCSPNGYPLSAGDTYSQIALGFDGVLGLQITPTVTPGTCSMGMGAGITDPGDNVGTYCYDINNNLIKTDNGNLISFNPDSSVNYWFKNLSSYYGTDWVYSIDKENWYTDVNTVNNQIKGVPGEHTVYCRYVIYSKGDTSRKTPCYKMKYTSAVSAASDENYVITEKVITVSQHAYAKFTSPTAKTNLFYTGSPQVLINAGTPGLYTKSLEYSLNGTNWYSDVNSITGTNAGVYTIRYRAVGENSYVLTPESRLAVEIKRLDPGLSPGTLAKIPGLVYNANSQQLFKGGATRTGDGTIYYADVWTSGEKSIGEIPKPAAGITNAGGGSGSIYISDCVGEDAHCSDGGNPCMRYLWYRVEQGTNHYAVDWTLLLDDSGNPVVNQIAPATLDVNATIMDSHDYDGLQYQVVKSASITCNSTSADVINNFSVVYTANCTYATGNRTRSAEFGDIKTFLSDSAGTYTASVKWSAKDTITNPYNYVSGSKEIGESYIYQLNKGDNVTVTGIVPDTNLALNDDGVCFPILEASVDLLVCGQSLNNGITTYDPVVDVDSTGEPINKVSFCFSKQEIAPNGGYVSADSPSVLNEKLKQASIDSSGTWYLYFNVERHNNLKTGTKIHAATFMMNAVEIGLEDLQGFLPADSVTYNGLPYQAYTGEGLSLAEMKGDLGSISYAVTASSISPSPTSEEWKTSVTDLPEQTEAGTYFLYAKWTGSGSIAAGMLTTGTFTIEKYSADNSKLYFSGNDFSSWGEPLPNNSLAIYSSPYTNNNINLGTMTEPAAHVNDDYFASIEPVQFGTLAFAVGNASEPTGYYYNDYSSVIVKDVGTYYVWASWTGSENVNPGTALMAYQADSGDLLTPVFMVTTLTDNSGIQLCEGDYADSMEVVEYKYDIVDSAGSSAYKGVAQPLFTATNLPIITLNGADYTTGISYSYLLATEGADVDANTQASSNCSGWQSSIHAATVTDFGVYYLWVKVDIDSTNVQTSTGKIIQLSTIPAAITETSSFAATAPVAIDSVYDGEAKQLIYASTQISPTLEYSLNGYDWYSDVTCPDLKITEAGTHKVYYRGAALSPMFKAQDFNSNQYVAVTIRTAKAGIETYPSLIRGVIYTGKGIAGTSLINDGTTTNVDVVIEYSWDKTDWYSIVDLPTKTESGNYLVYYRLNTSNDNLDIDTSSDSFEVIINKADISIVNPTIKTDGDLIYKAADYHLFLEDSGYGMVDTDGKPLKNVNGVSLTYENRETSGAGTMGTIYYGYSTSPTIQPSNWKTTYTDVVARTVGDYYVWIKVDAGTNHNGKPATCYNINTPIKIIPCNATYSGLDGIYDGFNFTQFTATSIPDLRYNGQTQNLLSSLTFNYKVANRNDHGEVLDTSGAVATTTESIAYNIVPEGDITGTTYYYLAIDDTTPGITDFSSNGWQKNWYTLTKIDVGTYYVCLMFDPSTNSNLGETLVYTTHHLAQYSEHYIGGAPQISPATYDDINKLTGIVGLEKMYDGTAQTLASGALIVRHITSDKDLTSQIVEQSYCFVKNGDSPASTNSTWTSFANTKVTDVGEYQLYVKLTTTKNIDCTNKPLIYPLLGTNYAEMVRVDADRLNIVAPGFVTTLVYNGSDLNLLNKSANLVMKSSQPLNGALGAVTYYISGSPTHITSTGTTLGGSETGYDNFSKVKEKHAGTYYIWVSYAQGDSHLAVAPRYVGSVSIAQATMDRIKLSGIEFTTNTYNGEEHQLTNTPVIQSFSSSDKVLSASDEYSKIEYAYSNDPKVAPDNNLWIDETDIANLTAINAGNYYIWIRVTAKTNPVTNQKNIEDYTRCYSDVGYSDIIQATLTNNNFDGIQLHEDLVYIAEYQLLASIPDKLVLSLDSSGKDLNTAGYNSDLIIYWALGEGTGSNYAPKPSDWTRNIEEVQSMDHGDYYLWVWVPESKNINEYKAYYATIHIAKATIHFTQEPVVYDDLVYNGDYQELINSVPVIKFYATGPYYDKVYYDAIGLTIEYRNVTTNSAWTENYREVSALDALTYNIAYRVSEADNWKLAQEDIDVVIAAADASKDGVGLIEAPKILTEVTYNETEQDLISFGILSDNLPVAGRGAALEGSKIVFYYADDDRQTEYKYYYDVESNEYVWDSVNGPLPGRTEVGSYLIKYYVTASTTGNFKASDVYELNAVIAKRPIYWEVNPQSIYGLKFTSNEQQILVAGELNVGKTVAKGVQVLYTLDEPGTDRHWQEDIPVVYYPDLWYVWYRVKVNDNNVFVGPENNDEDEGTMVVVLIEKNILTIRDLPRPNTLQYTAEEQSLVDYYYLSTDGSDDLKDIAPFIEYSFDKNASDENWSRVIKAKDCGEYVVYYRLNYNSTLFEFKGENDGRIEPMQVTVVIEAKTFEDDSLYAIFDPNDGGKLTYEVDKVEKLNQETGEYELLPIYSDTLLKEIENYIEYSYRRYDQYEQSPIWLPWTDEMSLSDLGLGSYQFKLSIVNTDNSNLNFYNYTQDGVKRPYSTYTIKEDRVINIIMPKKQYEIPAYVRAWIDFTSTTSYEDAKFKFEGWVDDETGKLEIPFLDVDSTGIYGQAVIRLQTVNSSYYYMSEYELKTVESKKNIDLSGSSTKVKAFNSGLIEPQMNIYLYEIYHIRYDANGGIGDELEEGWKWHNVDYLLEENKFTKIEDGKSLTANGWNTSKAGNGNNYNSGSMYYRKNASQVFYAKFFMPGENFYTIEWVIDNGSKRYTLSRDFGVWFDVTNPSYESRSTGMLIAEGDLIVLPQIQVDENNESLSGIFGGYILGWHTVEDNTPYSVGITATRNVTFIAELSTDLDNYVECEFKDDFGDVIHYSGQVADGAKAYMALSGMSANTIKEYNTGYTAWVQRYGFDYLDASKTPDGVLRYDLGAKTAIEEQPTTNQEQITWDDYVPMFIILALGVVATIASLTVYIIMRKKHKLSI